MDAWCPHCERTVGPTLTTPASAWLTGCGGCLGASVALFFLLGIVLGLLRVSSTATDAVTRLAVLPVALVAIIVGVVVLMKRRRRICPICRTASLTRPLPSR